VSLSQSSNPFDFLSDDVLRLNRGKLESAGFVQISANKTGAHSTEKGWLTIAGKRSYYKSKWEMNYAHYLQWLKERHEIIDWEYEPETFWFEGIRRGVTNYKPDFRITSATGIEFHEVKGYMDPKSKTKLARMKKYHPNVRMVLIDRDQMSSLKQYAGMIPGWR
jgi:hypothetical protein